MDYFIGEEDASGDYVILRTEELRHCVKVMRHKIGDIVMVTNGLGKLWKGTLTDDKKEAVELKIKILSEHHGQGEDPLALVLASALPEDPGRIEWMLEKSVELGVSEIFLLKSGRSGFPKIKENRLQKILIQAVKQSGRCVIPRVNPEISLENFLSKHPFQNFLKLSGSASGNPVNKYNHTVQTQATVLMCGPEGDFTPEEWDLIEKNGYEPVALGRFRLRAETAGIALLSWARANRG